LTHTPKKLRLAESAGVTLIELMIVLVIVSIGIMALSGVQTSSTTNVYRTGRRTQALAVAQTEMEVGRSLGYTLAIADTGQTGIYNWVAAVDSVNVGLKRITITVSWTEKAATDSVKLFDLVSAR
jgi:prepilin-type N-terminal cleavage/methylation domain-containing protein